MIKLILISVLALTVTVQGCRDNCPNIVPTKSLLCATEKAVATTCQLLSQCRLNVENCNRRRLNRPLLTPVSSSSCRNIKRPNRSGPCATKCRDLKCLDISKTTSCYRSKRNHCRLLNNCQMQRLNCERGHLNRVEWVDPRQCAGLRAGKVAKCKVIRK